VADRKEVSVEPCDVSDGAEGGGLRELVVLGQVAKRAARQVLELHEQELAAVLVPDESINKKGDAKDVDTHKQKEVWFIVFVKQMKEESNNMET